MVQIFPVWLAAASIASVGAVTPYTLLDSWNYVFEAGRDGTWPECDYRFLSYSDDCTSTIDFWNHVGMNQMFTLESVEEGGGQFWRMLSRCGSAVAYATNECDNGSIFFNDSTSATVASSFSTLWQLEASSDLSWNLVANLSSECGADQYLGFDVDCDSHGVYLTNNVEGANVFFLHPFGNSHVEENMVHFSNTNYQGCADPFVWRDDSSTRADFKSSKESRLIYKKGGVFESEQDDSIGEDIYYLACTSGSLPLYYSTGLSSETMFLPIGYLLNDSNVEPPTWAANTDRWAPENKILDKDSGRMLAVFCDTDTQGIRRLGTVLNPQSDNSADSMSGGWSVYSSDFIDLGGGDSGEIDGHFFEDKLNNKTYLVYKSDDNSVNMKYTRIYAVEVELPTTTSSSADLLLLGEPRLLLNSTGLWWVDSWVVGGSLIEGPEIVYRQGYYYLFFASGKYCTDSYAEGVARSSASVFGPYEKLRVPLLSTHIIGNGTKGLKLIGPGHSSFVFSPNASQTSPLSPVEGSEENEGEDKGVWYSVWHASEGENCERNAYVDKLSWTEDGWPVIDLTPD